MTTPRHNIREIGRGRGFILNQHETPPHRDDIIDRDMQWAIFGGGIIFALAIIAGFFLLNADVVLAFLLGWGLTCAAFGWFVLRLMKRGLL